MGVSSIPKRPIELEPATRPQGGWGGTTNKQWSNPDSLASKNDGPGGGGEGSLVLVPFQSAIRNIKMAYQNDVPTRRGLIRLLGSWKGDGGRFPL